MRNRERKGVTETALPNVHPNTLRLLAAIRRIGFGRITEITVANGIPLRFRVEQLVDLSKAEQPLLEDQAEEGFDTNLDRQ